VNLAVNARDAMPNGGGLEIRTANADFDEPSPDGITPGRYVMLSVADTGVGMDEETRSRIFEPFFTTKEVGNGTGLGLSMVYGIVKQSRGHIRVDSEPGRGTTFGLFLPRLDEQVAAPERKRKRVAPPRGSETILLVEDEDVLRRLGRRVLELGGYSVLEAREGREALHVCEEHEGPLNLVVTDVVMPRMGGRELAEQIARTSPDTKTLYVSGYTDDVVVRNGVLEKGTAFLQKPFTPSALLAKVREVLDTNGGDGVGS
jgi:CheY-like chemotaxis protein